MSFIEHAYRELKAIEPKITADEFSTKWLNKCSSYYRSYKSSDRDMTLHALMCLSVNLSKKSDALRRNNDHQLLHEKAEQYDHLHHHTKTQISYLIR
jgi:hypothetical protein